jgi:hypothetical protein
MSETDRIPYDDLPRVHSPETLHARRRLLHAVFHATTPEQKNTLRWYSLLTNHIEVLRGIYPSQEVDEQQDPHITNRELYRRYDGETTATRRRITNAMLQDPTDEEFFSLLIQLELVRNIEILFGIMQPQNFGERVALEDLAEATSKGE